MTALNSISEFFQQEAPRRTSEKVSLIFIATLVFSGVSLAQTSTSAQPQANTISLESWFQKGRPANMYRMGTETDPGVCQPMLSALNEPAKLPEIFKTYETSVLPENGEAYIPNRSAWFSALHTKLSVNWTPLQHYASPTMSIERALVDLDQDGKSEAVYRQLRTGPGSRYFYSYMSRTSTYPEEETIFSRARQDAIWQDRYGERPFKGKALPGSPSSDRAALFLNIEGYPEGLLPENVVKVSRLEGLKEVAKVGDKYLLLVVAENHYQNRPFSVYALHVIDNRHQKLVCRFDSNFQIANSIQ